VCVCERESCLLLWHSREEIANFISYCTNLVVIPSRLISIYIYLYIYVYNVYINFHLFHFLLHESRCHSFSICFYIYVHTYIYRNTKSRCCSIPIYFSDLLINLLIKPFHSDFLKKKSEWNGNATKIGMERLFL